MAIVTPETKPSTRWAALRFLGGFAAISVAGIAALLIEPIDTGLIQPFCRMLAAASAAAITLFGGSAAANGAILSLVKAGGGVEIANGCNAVEASILLAAAILAFPARIGHRLIGAALGILMLQVVNLLRIVSLLYLNRYAPSWFDFFHLYLWDALIMLDGLLIFLVWHRWQDRPRATAAA
jgi:exosortase H (IPTLxxWG-CTERM-specific)